MTDSIISQLLDFGALGIFAGFLIWQHLGMQKRLDHLVEGFQSQLRDINEEFDKRVERMRGRYDIVIENIRRECRENEDKVVAERDRIREKFTFLATESDKKLDEILQQVRKR